MIKKLITITFILLIGFQSIGQVIIPSKSLKKHVYFLASDSLEGRGLGTPSGLKAAEYIADHFKACGLQTIGDDYLHTFYIRKGQTVLKGNNVVGIIEGSDPELKDEYILLGAHYDHIAYKFKNGKKVVYNGADDNATGTASIMEMGKAFVEHKEHLKRSIIIVAFDGEESGLLGSWKFIDQDIIPTESIKLMMSIDMIGRFAESESLIMGAMGTLIDGEEMLDKIAAKHEIKIKKTGKKISNRTDSKHFGAAGIPSLHVTSGIIGPYHKPEDDRETIDYEGMEKISSMLFELNMELANRNSLQATKKLIAQSKRKGLPLFRFGVKANLGRSYHNYSDAFFNGKGRFAYEVGLFGQLKITNHFSLQPEVLYSSLASDFQTGNFRTHSITTPLSLVLATSMNKEMNQRFYAKVGGYYRYHFYGSANKEELDFKNSFEQEEIGLAYGVGLEIMSFFAEVNFNHALTDVSKDPILGEFRNRATYFTLGYMF